MIKSVVLEVIEFRIDPELQNKTPFQYIPADLG